MAGKCISSIGFLVMEYTHKHCSYLFDVFLGPSYNQSPPSVKYMTVSQGIYLRHNPKSKSEGDQWRKVSV